MVTANEKPNKCILADFGKRAAFLQKLEKIRQFTQTANAGVSEM